MTTNSQPRGIAASRVRNRSGSETRQRNRDCKVRLLDPEADFLEQLASDEGLTRQQLFLRECLWPRIITAGIDVSDASSSLGRRPDWLGHARIAFTVPLPAQALQSRSAGR